MRRVKEMVKTTRTSGRPSFSGRHFRALLNGLVAAVLLGSAAGPAVRAAETEAASTQLAVFEMVERCGDSFGLSAVSYPFRAESGRCERERLALRGPNGLIPHQLSDVVLWPDGKSVKSARVWFRAALDAGQTRRYTLEVTAAPIAPGGDSDLLVVRNNDQGVEFSTPGVGIRFRRGAGRFPAPLPPREVPGPVASVRLADGTWFGDSGLYGERLVSEFDATLAAAGPIFAEMRLRYVYADHTTLTLRARLFAGEAQVNWSMAVTPYDRDAALRHVTEPWQPEDPLAPRDASLRDGWRITLGANATAMRFLAVPEFGANRWGKHEWVAGRWRDDPVAVSPDDEPPGLLVNVAPWSDWWDSSTKTRLSFVAADGRPLLEIRARQPGEWVEPAPPGTLAPWGNRRMRQQWVPLVKGREGTLSLDFSLSGGRRHWSWGAPADRDPAELDRMKDRILAWNEAGNPHPRLYMDAASLGAVRRRPAPEALIRGLVAAAGPPQPEPHQSDAAALGAWLLTGDRRVADQVSLVARLLGHLGLRGEFDRMRGTYLLCGLYDGVLGGDLLDPAQRAACRARMADLAYRIADPETWSMERGYCSGNLNMSVAHVLNQGMLACTLADHPNAAAWTASGLAMLERQLEDTVGPDGEWPESIANYAHVSVAAMLPVAIAAHRAGFSEQLADPRLKRLLLFIAKHYTPPDPRPTEDGAVNVSVLPPVGRAGARGRNGLPGLMAKATAATDPEYSAVLQWVWRRAGMPRTIPDSRMGGWEHVYLDEALPATAPAWGLDLFPRAGAILRDAVGTPDEWWAYLMATEVDAYPSEVGGLPLVFARGVPIIARFSGGYAEREELFINRVLPARPRGDQDFRQRQFCHETAVDRLQAVTTAHAEYLEARLATGAARFVSHQDSAHDRMQELPEWPGTGPAGEGTSDWTRRLLLLKGPVAGTGTMFVLDSVAGGQPSIWQMWLLSNGIRPLGHEGLPSAGGGSGELPGNLFRASGQFGVDTDIFVAAPAATPRSTLRWGREYDYAPLLRLREDMDLLHLQRPDDGDYFVAFHPRRPDEPSPRFSTLAEGRVIRVDHPDRIDYAFLAGQESEAVAEGIRFKGRAIVYRSERAGPTVIFSAPGGVQFAHRVAGEDAPRAVELVASRPAEFSLRPDRIRIAFAPGHRGTATRIKADGSWRVVAQAPGLAVYDEGVRGVRLHAQPEAREAVFERVHTPE